MKILVAGGAGYIGSHTCVELIKAGFDVVIVDNFSNAREDVMSRLKTVCGRDIPLVRADIRDERALRDAFAEHKPDAVIHFAGFKAVGESVAKPIEYYDNNIIGFLCLTKVMREAGCKKLVFSSSATVYGMNNTSPLMEDMPISATNPYGYTKVMIEQMLRDIAHADPEWSICMLRYFNPIGAHESGLLGEEPNGIPNNLVPYISMVAGGELKALSVYGNDYDTPDGTGVRDYIHVVDLALGHIAALRYVETHTGAEAVNLGTGHGSSVLEMVAAFQEACGKPIPYRVMPRRPGDIATAYADTHKALELFGWRATMDIRRMCQDSWRFEQTRIART